MASVASFGDLHFRTIGPDEVALLARTSCLYGMTPEGRSEAGAIRQTVRELLPILREAQIAVVLTAFKQLSKLTPEWESLRQQLEHQASGPVVVAAAR